MFQKNDRRSTSPLVLFIIGFWLQSGCVLSNNRLAKRISYISLTPKPDAAALIGPVTSKDCAIQVGGFTFAPPQLGRALEDLHPNRKIQYLRHVSINLRSTYYVFYVEHCYLISGEGFK